MAEKSTKKATKNAKVVKSVEDLQVELATKRADLLATKRSHAAGELVNPRAITSQRKEIARLLTEINERKGE